MTPLSSIAWNFALAAANLTGSRRRNLVVDGCPTVVMTCCTPWGGWATETAELALNTARKRERRLPAQSDAGGELELAAAEAAGGPGDGSANGEPGEVG
jgi:hypothetical protein